MQEIQNRLEKVLSLKSSAVIAFSGGADSALLLAMAKGVIHKLLAVTFRTPLHPESDTIEACELAAKLGVDHRVIDINPLTNSLLQSNPKERCYICKRFMFQFLVDIAKNEDYECVMDGSNSDDLKEVRPGRFAVKEMGIISPLEEAEVTKSDVRSLSRKLDLAVWNKPAFACYFTRFAYGETITQQMIEMVMKAETELHKIGLSSARVRFHGTTARVELSEPDIKTALSTLRKEIISIVKNAGFIFVAIDLEGYRSGSMDEAFIE